MKPLGTDDGQAPRSVSGRYRLPRRRGERPSCASAARRFMVAVGHDAGRPGSVAPGLAVTEVADETYPCTEPGIIVPDRAGCRRLLSRSVRACGLAACGWAQQLTAG